MDLTHIDCGADGWAHFAAVIGPVMAASSSGMSLLAGGALRRHYSTTNRSSFSPAPTRVVYPVQSGSGPPQGAEARGRRVARLPGQLIGELL
jgi:hypothetical protein